MANDQDGGALDQHLDEALDELAKHYSGREFAAAEHGVKLLYKRLDAERSEQDE